MSKTDIIIRLEQENLQLKKDNEKLLSIITQMKVTLNRLVNHYLSADGSGNMA